jgi:hypothetical protein
MTQTTLLFSYSGAELVPLLSKLLDKHAADVAALDAKLNEYTPGQKAAALRPSMAQGFEYDAGGNLRRRPQASNEVGAVLQARDDAWIAKRETELWLLEAYRAPKTRWQLTLRDLARLYPEQTFAETLALYRAGPRAPSGLLGRLLAALQAWIVPRRRALLPRAPVAG